MIKAVKESRIWIFLQCEYFFGEGSCGCIISKLKNWRQHIKLFWQQIAVLEQILKMKTAHHVNFVQKQWQKIEFKCSYESQNSENKDSKQQVNFVTEAVKESRIWIFLWWRIMWKCLVSKLRNWRQHNTACKLCGGSSDKK